MCCDPMPYAIIVIYAMHARQTINVLPMRYQFFYQPIHDYWCDLPPYDPPPHSINMQPLCYQPAILYDCAIDMLRPPRFATCMLHLPAICYQCLAKKLPINNAANIMTQAIVGPATTQYTRSGWNNGPHPSSSYHV